MKLLGIIDEDFVNYKKICMTLMFPHCNFKCEKYFEEHICQNYLLQFKDTVDIDIDNIIQRYYNNPITSAICFQGLEPLDSWYNVGVFINTIRLQYNILDDIVIYTGYNKNEILALIDELKIHQNIIIKYGRYIPNQKPHYDKVLGVELASDNQYAERIS